MIFRLILVEHALNYTKMSSWKFKKMWKIMNSNHFVLPTNTASSDYNIHVKFVWISIQFCKMRNPMSASNSENMLIINQIRPDQPIYLKKTSFLPRRDCSTYPALSQRQHPMASTLRKTGIHHRYMTACIEWSGTGYMCSSIFGSENCKHIQCLLHHNLYEHRMREKL